MLLDGCRGSSQKRPRAAAPPVLLGSSLRSATSYRELKALERMARARSSVGLLGCDVRPVGDLRCGVDVGCAGELPSSAGRGGRPGVVDCDRRRPAAGGANRGVSSLADGYGALAEHGACVCGGSAAVLGVHLGARLRVGRCGARGAGRLRELASPSSRERDRVGAGRVGAGGVDRESEAGGGDGVLRVSSPAERGAGRGAAASTVAAERPGVVPADAAGVRAAALARSAGTAA